MHVPEGLQYYPATASLGGGEPNSSDLSRYRTGNHWVCYHHQVLNNTMIHEVYTVEAPALFVITFVITLYIIMLSQYPTSILIAFLNLGGGS